MEALSRADKKRLDQAVLVAAAHFYDNRELINTLHWDRPRRFTELLHLHLNMSSDPGIEAIVLTYNTTDAGTLIASSIRRLRRKQLLRIEYITVPVMLDMKKLVKRRMSCYWPTTVLESLAQID